MADPRDDFNERERGIIMRFLLWLLRLFGWSPPEAPGEPTEPIPPTDPGGDPGGDPEDPEEPQEPPDEEPDDPDDPEEPDEPVLEAVVIYASDLRHDDSWAPTVGDDPALLAMREGDGDLTATLGVALPSGVYAMWVRAWAPDKNSDAFYGGARGHTTHRCWPDKLREWRWVLVGGYDLDGDVVVGLGTGETGLIVDCIVLDPTGLTAESLDDLAGVAPPIEEQQEPSEPDVPVEPEPPVDPEEPQHPSPGGLSDGIFNVAPLVDSRFDQANPTLRTGQRLTAAQLYYHDAFRAAFLNPNATQYTAPRKVFNTGNSYHLGRHGEVMQEPALQVMARTGDGHILDELVRGWRLAYDHLVIEWDAKTATMKDESYSYVVNNAGASIRNGKWVFKDSRRPWSPHKKWLYHWGSPSGGRGTDLNNLQTLKPWSILTRFLWVLEANRNAKSPAGFDYGAEADRWKSALRGFIDAYTSDTGADWEDNYRGLDAKWTGGGSRIRAKPGQWPFFIRTEGHVIFNAMLLCFYCGLLGDAGWDIPNHNEAFKGADAIAQRIRETLVETKDSKGRPSLLLPQGNTIMKATYTAYPAWELAHIRDIGRWDHIFDDETLLRLSRSYADMIKPDGSTLGDLAAEKDRTGHGYTVNHGSPRTPYQHAINGFSLPMLWAETDYLFNTGTAAQTSTGDGGYGAKPKLHIIPAAQFLTAVRA